MKSLFALIPVIRWLLVSVGSLSSIICVCFVVLSLIRLRASDDQPQPVNTQVTSPYSSCYRSKHWCAREDLLEPVPSFSGTVWGSFRPGSYFGMKSRTPTKSISTGIMWTSSVKQGKQFRDTTNQDEVKRFEWVRHDGKNFGTEHIVDPDYGFLINASFVIPDDSILNSLNDTLFQHKPAWAQTFTIKPTSIDDKARKSLLFYIGVDCPSKSSCVGNSNVHSWRITKHTLSTKQIPSQAVTLSGFSALTGWFCLTMIIQDLVGLSGQDSLLSSTGFVNTDILTGVDRLKQEVSELTSPRARKRNRRASNIFNEVGDLNNIIGQDASFVALQVAFESETRIDAVFQEQLPVSTAQELNDIIANNEFTKSNSMETLPIFHRTNDLSNTKGMAEEIQHNIDNWINYYSQRFDTKFNNTFYFTDSVLHHNGNMGNQLARPDTYKIDRTDIEVMKVSLSSMLGGIGYFQGNPVIDIANDDIGDIKEQTQTIVGDVSANIHAEIEVPVISLLTASPSRTVFPRGFLWDEGYHQLLISQWEPKLTIEIIRHWLGALHFPCSASSPLTPTANSNKRELLNKNLSAVTNTKAMETTMDSDLIRIGETLFNSSSIAASAKCVGGWIPREMILGDEAKRRVPDEFLVQRVNIANPPTLLLAVDSLLTRFASTSVDDAKLCHYSSESDNDSDFSAVCIDDDTGNQAMSQNKNASESSDRGAVISFLREAYPKLHQWMQWFLHTQQGAVRIPGSFRWRGRSQSDGKVVPNTLASGLDDYPRAPQPTAEEHHVDLHSWMTKGCAIMARLEKVLADSGYPLSPENQEIAKTMRYDARAQYLLKRLDELHWSEQYSGYFDVGMNSEESYFTQDAFFRCGNYEQRTQVELTVPLEVIKAGRTDFCPASHPSPLGAVGSGDGGYRVVERFVVPPSAVQSHIPRVGYVSIFPLLLKLLSPSSHRLGAVLDMVEDPQKLWTEFGLRSMGPVDKFYQKRNSPGDAPYWRGPIWIPINYLALSALHHYASVSGPHQIRTSKLYHRLRSNVLRTVLGQYKTTGQFWEQYEDDTGNGMRGKHFTGWTALVVIIAAEKF